MSRSRLVWIASLAVLPWNSWALAETPPSFILQWGQFGHGPGQFASISAVAAADDGSVYVTDYDNKRVQKFNSMGSFVTQWGGLGAGDGQFSGPGGVAVDHEGNVYVTDDTGRIQKFAGNGMFITSWRGPDEPNVSLCGEGIAVGPDHTVYFADGGAQCRNAVFRFSPEGALLSTWDAATSGAPQFGSPLMIAVGPSGEVFLMDNGNYRVVKLSATGTFLTQWSLPQQGWIAVDAQGNVYVTQSQSGVRKYDGNGTLLCSWGSVGSEPGEMRGPAGIAVDSSGNLFVVDRGNERILKFGPLPTPSEKTPWSRLKAIYR